MGLSIIKIINNNAIKAVWITLFDTFHLFTSLIDRFYTKSSAVDSFDPQDMRSVDNHPKNIANTLFFCYDICVLTRE